MTKREKTRRAALYLRVSTDGQTTENQRHVLTEVARRSGWAVVDIYEDAGVSGANGRDRRPEFDRLCKDAARRKFGLVAAWSVDRLGRSLQDLVAFLGEIHATGVDLYLHQQAVDTTTPAGRAMFGMLGVFAEFERALIQERVRAGLARARAKGKRLGRPRTVTPALVTKARAARDAGGSLRQIARELGTSVGSVRRALAEVPI